MRPAYAPQRDWLALPFYLQNRNQNQLECGPIPNVMAALRNISGAVCSTPQSLADAHCWSTVQKRCKDAKPVEINWDAPNYRTDLSR